MGGSISHLSEEERRVHPVIEEVVNGASDAGSGAMRQPENNQHQPDGAT